jgi:hypothetical protein
MEPIYRGVAGSDVHEKMLAAVVRREWDGRTQYEKRKFGTTRNELDHLVSIAGPKPTAL